MMYDLMGCGPVGGIAVGFAIFAAVLISVVLLLTIASLSKYLLGANGRIWVNPS